MDTLLLRMEGHCIDNELAWEHENCCSCSANLVAVFSRVFCLKELAWAKRSGKVIQPVVTMDDKQRIGKRAGAPCPLLGAHNHRRTVPDNKFSCGDMSV